MIDHYTEQITTNYIADNYNQDHFLQQYKQILL